MLVKYTTIDRIFNFVNRKIKPQGFEEIDIINWTGEALEFMSVPKMYEQAICYTEVQNYQATIPQWTHNIIQIVKDNKYEPSIPTSVGICPINILTGTEEEITPEEETENGVDCCNPKIPSCYYLPEGDGHPVIINQLGEPLTEYELAFYRPYFDLKYDYLSWTGSALYQGRFTPIRLATNHFYNTIVCQSEDCDIPYQSCAYEYTIIEGSILRFNFREGGVVIAYERQQTDENGIPLIPDDVSVIKAIEFYIRWQYALEDFSEHVQGSGQLLSKFESDWHWYCKQAKNKFKMPSTVDEWQNLLEGRNYLIPRQQYYGFFGYAGKAEQRRYLTNTNRR